MTVVVLNSVVFAVAVTASVAARPHEINPLVFAALAVLFVLAENRDRVFADETGLSCSIAVGLAASVYFGAAGWVGGAFLVGACGGCYLRHVRSREWAKVVVNATCFGVACAAAASIVQASADLMQDSGLLVVAAIVATLAYWLVNSVLLACAMSSLRGGGVGDTAAFLIRSDTVMLAFGVVGALCGVVMVEVGPWVGIVAVAASLVALDVFVISVPGGPSTLLASWKMLLTRFVAAATAGVLAWLATSVTAAAGDLGAVFVGLAVGTMAGLGVVVGISAARVLLAGRRPHFRVLAGVAIAEAPLVAVACVAGTVAATIDVAAAFMTGSVLVLIGSLAAAWWSRRQLVEEHDPDLVLAAVTDAILDGFPDPDRRRR